MCMGVQEESPRKSRSWILRGLHRGECEQVSRLLLPESERDSLILTTWRIGSRLESTFGGYLSKSIYLKEQSKAALETRTIPRYRRGNRPNRMQGQNQIVIVRAVPTAIVIM